MNTNPLRLAAGKLITPAAAAALMFATLSAAALAQPAQGPADSVTNSNASDPTTAAGGSAAPSGAATTSDQTAGAVDSERVIRYDELNRAMQSAASAVVKPIQDSELSERFTELIELASQESVDTAELSTMLTRLRDELDTFSTSLDQAPIWEAQGLLSDTVERVRLYVTQGPAGVPSAELDAQIAELDKQLARLARMIDNEPDPDRVRRLKALFGHQLRMKRLKEAAANIDTADPSVSVWLDIAGSLERISVQLTTTAFTVEEARLAIQGVSDRLTLHINTLDALAGRERVAEAISAVGSTSSELAGAMTELVSVARQANELDRALQGLTTRLVQNVELDGAAIPDQDALGSVVPGDMDLDAEIQKYLDRERAAQGRADAVGSNALGAGASDEAALDDAIRRAARDGSSSDAASPDAP